MVRRILFGGFALFLLFRVGQCAIFGPDPKFAERAAADAAVHAQHRAEEDAKKLADQQVTRRMDAASAMTDNPTAANIAEWEAASKATYGPDWQGDWQAEVSANRGYWANAYAQDQANQLRENLKDRPVIVVVSER